MDFSINQMLLIGKTYRFNRGDTTLASFDEAMMCVQNFKERYALFGFEMEQKRVSLPNFI